jgi:long-subunit fatty acid transport protein
LPIPMLAIAGTAQFDPRQLIGAATWRIAPEIAASLSLGWENWSRYKNPIVYTAVPEGYPPQPEPDFRDIFTARVGGEYSLALAPDLTLIPRAGFGFSPTPVPPQTEFHNYLDSGRLITAAGAGLRYRWLRVDAAMQWHLFLGRTEDKSTTTRDVRHGGHVLATSFEVGVEL